MSPNQKICRRRPGFGNRGRRPGVWGARNKMGSFISWLIRWWVMPRAAADRGRPLVFGVVRDQPLADVQAFVEESGVDVIQLRRGSLGTRNHPSAARASCAEPSSDIDAAADLAKTYAQVASAKCCLVLVDAAAAARCPEVRSPFRLARRRVPTRSMTSGASWRGPRRGASSTARRRCPTRFGRSSRLEARRGRRTRRACGRTWPRRGVSESQSRIHGAGFSSSLILCQRP